MPGFALKKGLRNDGKVLAIGDPSCEGLSGNYSELTIIPTLENITKLRVSSLSHIVALNKDGQAYATKVNYGSIFKKRFLSPPELITTGKKVHDIDSGDAYTVLTMEDGSLLGLSQNKNIPAWMKQTEEYEASASLKLH